MNDKAGTTPRRWLAPSAALNRFKPPPRSVAIGIAPTERKVTRYGFRIGSIGLLISENTTSEVFEQTPIYPLPNTPSWLRGLINLRGNLAPVFDIKQFLELEESTIQEKRRLLILDQGDKTVGIMIDGLPQVAELSHPLSRPPLLPAALQTHVAKAYAQDDILWFEFDHQGFFQALGGQITGVA